MAKHVQAGPPGGARQEGAPPVAAAGPKAGAEPPAFVTVGIRREDGMWVAELLVTRGDVVVKRERLAGPDIKVLCLDKAVAVLEATL